ncbi:hypothetical protein IFM89_023501 [Coptis chinensis]|uniref:Kinesin motor domain-containing protein n=1 Tax=Coptis chinensis TaxID=261450 RepID=A0A835LW93_9MAGN|nr:hypothetical protein IFM89_023501 [Coptis chinensis]
MATFMSVVALSLAAALVILGSLHGAFDNNEHSSLSAKNGFDQIFSSRCFEVGELLSSMDLSPTVCTGRECSSEEPQAWLDFMMKFEIRQVANGVYHVLGLVESHVSNMNDVWEVLQTGDNLRAVGVANAIEHSSRSHWSHIISDSNEWGLLQIEQCILVTLVGL